MTRLSIKEDASGQRLLNVGCGNHYSQEWNNIDFNGGSDVIAHDLRCGLPYPDASMDAVYSSHVLEHFSLQDGAAILSEMHRVLRPGGVIRIVVPDLERVCREYLENLEKVTTSPNEKNRQRYTWVLLELLDQMVREQSGGNIRSLIDSGDFDKAYVRERVGAIADSAPTDTIPPSFLRRIVRRIRRSVHSRNPRKIGELHKWMYDCFSLAEALRKAGFLNPQKTSFNTSAIPHWEHYALDASGEEGAMMPRKPESLFMEATA